MEDCAIHYCWYEIPSHGIVRLGTGLGSGPAFPWHGTSEDDFKRDLGEAFADTIKALGEPVLGLGPEAPPASPMRTGSPSGGREVPPDAAIWKRNKPPPSDILEVLKAAYTDRKDASWVCAAFSGRGVTEHRVTQWLSNKSWRDRNRNEGTKPPACGGEGRGRVRRGGLRFVGGGGIAQNGQG